MSSLSCWILCGLVTTAVIKTELILGDDTFLGCFVDGGGPRDLTGKVISTSSMTQQFCSSYCQGFTVYGLQAGSYCFCGSSFGKYQKVDVSQCNQKCSGAASANCGATLRNAVYQYVTPSTTNYLGCYVDTNAARDLDGKVIQLPYMTVDFCATYCVGFAFYGLQYGQYCFCGNSYNKFGQSDVMSCIMNCPGNGNQVCGSTLRNSVYKYATPSTTNYIGCFVDTTAVRDLDGKYIQLASMTIEYCAGYCAGYAYYGLQYSQYCFCGNSYNKFGQSDVMSCLMNCAGNPAEVCGSTLRNSIYKMGPTACPEYKAADVTFLLDSSGSIGKDNFVKNVLGAVKSLVDVLLPNPPAVPTVRVALISFDDTVQLHFNLDTFSSKQDILTAVDQVQFRGGATSTGDAFFQLLNQVQPKVRSGGSDIVMFISDGKQTTGTHDSVTEAGNLKTAGATIFAVGVGPDTDKQSMDAISSGAKYRADVATFDSLKPALTSLMTSNCG